MDDEFELSEEWFSLVAISDTYEKGERFENETSGKTHLLYCDTDKDRIKRELMSDPEGYIEFQDRGFTLAIIPTLHIKKKIKY